MCDGYYGKKTESLVRHFQNMMGLHEDGVVDKELWNMVVGYS